jgi:hypothetical protein
MKTKSLILLAILGAVMVSGCGKSSSSTATPPATTPPPTTPPVIPGGGNTQPPLGANTVTFAPVSKARMEEYVGTRPLNNPSDFRLTVALKNVGGYKYAGEIKISYLDNGQTYTGIFTAPEGNNSSFDGMHDNGTLKAVYNYWFNFDGKTVFNGFFQDQYGAIVLVVDNYIDQGDGQGTTTLSGSVYFRNFPQSFAPQSTERNCWFVYAGPYDCRSYTVMNKTNTVPSDGYKLLGTFSGLVTNAAFQ